MSEKAPRPQASNNETLEVDANHYETVNEFMDVRPSQPEGTPDTNPDEWARYEKVMADDAAKQEAAVETDPETQTLYEGLSLKDLAELARDANASGDKSVSLEAQAHIEDRLNAAVESGQISDEGAMNHLEMLTKIMGDTTGTDAAETVAPAGPMTLEAAKAQAPGGVEIPETSPKESESLTDEEKAELEARAERAKEREAKNTEAAKEMADAAINEVEKELSTDDEAVAEQKSERSVNAQFQYDQGYKKRKANIENMRTDDPDTFNAMPDTSHESWNGVADDVKEAFLEGVSDARQEAIDTAHEEALAENEAREQQQSPEVATAGAAVAELENEMNEEAEAGEEGMQTRIERTKKALKELGEEKVSKMKLWWRGFRIKRYNKKAQRAEAQAKKLSSAELAKNIVDEDEADKEQ
ncbi:MAG: hypothetical protein ACTJG2_00210 [Candidatus Saccharimonadales bacterium]